ncbi:hypothetical protein [Allisonella histaminiformans]|uniref:hypothetical protein n=1 Tax=Allisonella histaminiformans TaxID=209880 RepID=UPI002E760E41|nr:hypothetical protein [Allisonella histaminiformans]
MNTNVNYYLSAFDKNGKRLASNILNNARDDKEIKANSESLKKIDGVEVIEVVTAEDYIAYLNGKIRDTTTGKPVDPPEPVISAEEKRASEANTIAQKYSSQIAELKDAMITAQLAGDADLAKSLTEEYKETMDAYTQELEALK